MFPPLLACSALSCLGPAPQIHMFFAFSLLTHPQTILQVPSILIPTSLPLPDSWNLQKPSPRRSTSLPSSEPLLLRLAPPTWDASPSYPHSPQTTAPGGSWSLSWICLLSQTHISHLSHLAPPPLSDPRPSPGSVSSLGPAPSPGDASQRPSASAARRGWGQAAGRRTPGGAPWVAAARLSPCPRPARWPPPPPPPHTGSWPSRASDRIQRRMRNAGASARGDLGGASPESQPAAQPWGFRASASHLHTARSRPAPLAPNAPPSPLWLHPLSLSHTPLGIGSSSLVRPLEMTFSLRAGHPSDSLGRVLCLRVTPTWSTNLFYGLCG